jgi:hypothetical protein
MKAWMLAAGVLLAVLGGGCDNGDDPKTTNASSAATPRPPDPDADRMGWRFVVYVRNPRNQPIAGATVAVSHADGPEAYGTTGQMGFVESANTWIARRGDSVRISVSAPGYQPAVVHSTVEQMEFYVTLGDL